MADPQYDVIVIGTGLAGLSAAQEAAQRGLTVATVESLMFGGLVININEMDPAPPGDELSGAGIASGLMSQVFELGVEGLNDEVTALAREGGCITVSTASGTHTARAVILASGARLKRAGIPGEAEFEHHGVSQCGDCDGPLFRDEDVMVLGGGDSALQEALVLAAHCRTVHLVHRGAAFRARQQFKEAVAGEGNIRILFNTVAEEILGADAVEKVRVRNVLDNTTTEIACAGFFAYIGLEPSTQFLPAQVKLDANGFAITDASLQTTLPGVFAAGAVRAGFGGLATDAYADARKAAASAATAISASPAP